MIYYTIANEKTFPGQNRKSKTVILSSESSVLNHLKELRVDESRCVLVKSSKPSYSTRM